jgi:fido (protein-threonine AMPylation protein)
MTDTVYCYPPDFSFLKNKLNLRDARELASFETEFVMQRIAEGAPTGNFDLAHVKAMHRHLFQDVYEWAGELRTVEISKDGHQFQARWRSVSPIHQCFGALISGRRRLGIVRLLAVHEALVDFRQRLAFDGGLECA